MGNRKPGTVKTEGGQEGVQEHHPSLGRSQATHGETQELGQEPALQECSVGTCGEGKWGLGAALRAPGAYSGGWKDGPTFMGTHSASATLPHRLCPIGGRTEACTPTPCECHWDCMKG